MLGDLDDEREDPVTEVAPDGLPAVGVGDVLEVVVEDGRGEDLVAHAEPGEDAHRAHQVCNVGNPARQEGLGGVAGVLLIGTLLSELVVVAAGRKAYRGLEQRGEQGPAWFVEMRRI